MVMDNLKCWGVLLFWIIIGKGLTVLAYRCVDGVVRLCVFLWPIRSFFLPLSRLYID